MKAIKSYTTFLLFSIVVSPTFAVAQTSPTITSHPDPKNYVLGVNDQVAVYVGDMQEDFGGKLFRIDSNGDLSLPIAGRVHAEGLTPEALEARIGGYLSPVLKDPKVAVSVAEFASQPISVLGAVTTPGVKQLQGQKTLFEVLSLSGGLRTDAGTTVKITRDLKWGAINLPGAKTDESGRYSVASVHVKSIMNATDPSSNIPILPGDVITVPRADRVFVVGSVVKPGGYEIGENETISTLQAVSLAEGLSKTAATEKAKILRAEPGSSTRTELPINLKLLMAGKTEDIALRPDDILFIPNSNAKSAGYRTLDAIIAASVFAAGKM